MRFLSRMVPTGLACVALSFSSVANGAEVYSQIVGAIAIDLPKESDSIVSFPFKQTASYQGAISSISGSSIGVSSDSLTSGAFDKSGSGNYTHFVYIESGTLMGRRFNVESNDGSSLDLGSSDLSGLAASDSISVREHWTLGKAFPNGVAFKEESSPGSRTIELIVPDKTSEGGGLAAESIYFFFNGKWRKFGDSLSNDHNEDVLEPGGSYVIRNNSAADLTAYTFGEVISAPLAIPVVSSASESIDNFVSLERPLAITLSELGLHDSGAFAASSNPDAPTDQLLVYALGASGKNRAPSSIYFYYNSAWRKVGESSGTDFSQDTIEPGMGIAVRKAAGQTATQHWVNQWELPQ